MAAPSSTTSHSMFVASSSLESAKRHRGLPHCGGLHVIEHLLRALAERAGGSRVHDARLAGNVALNLCFHRRLVIVARRNLGEATLEVGEHVHGRRPRAACAAVEAHAWAPRSGRHQRRGDEDGAEQHREVKREAE
eukprot:56537-Prymnesium_polylepis.2